MHLSHECSVVVADLLCTHFTADIQVYVFGSRAHGRGLKPFSDLDLCLRGQNRVSPELLDRLTEAFAQSDLPIRVDVVDWFALSDEFKAIIEPDLKPFTPSASPSSPPPISAPSSR